MKTSLTIAIVAILVIGTIVIVSMNKDVVAPTGNPGRQQTPASTTTPSAGATVQIDAIVR